MAEQEMVGRSVHVAVTTCENLCEHHYVIIPMSPSHDYLNWKIRVFFNYYILLKTFIYLTGFFFYKKQ